MRTQPHNGLSLLRGSFMENETNLNSNGKYQIRLKFSTYRRRSTRLESCPRISILCRVFQRQNKVYSYQTNKKKCYPALLFTVHDLWWLKSSHNAILSLRHGFQSNLPSSSSSSDHGHYHTSLHLRPYFNAHVLKIYSQDYLMIRRKGSNFSTITFKTMITLIYSY